MLKRLFTKSSRYLYLLGYRIIKLRNREALWELHEKFPFATTTAGIAGVLGPSRYRRFKMMEKAIFPGAVVLDVGCNIGECGAHLIKNGCIVYGVDVNPDFVKVAKSKGVFATVCPVEKITFPDNFFDLCIISEVLEHIYNPEEAIAQLHRVLRPGGKLVGTVPVPYDKFASHSKHQWVWHQHDFTKARLQSLLEKYFKAKNISIKEHRAERDESRLFFEGTKNANL